MALHLRRVLGRLKGSIPVGTGIATWGFANSGLTTFGVTPSIGQVPAGSFLKLGGLTTQTDIFATHGDGSIRHALISAAVVASGNLDVTVSATGPGVAFTPSNWPTCVVDMSIEGTSNWGTPGDVYRSSLPAYSTADRTCSGSVLQETHYRVIPARVSDAAAHPFLRVKYSVRSYSNGEHEVSVIGENILVNNPSPTARSVDYRLQITFNGNAVLDKAARVNPFTVSHTVTVPSDNTQFTTSVAHNLTKGDCIKVTSGADVGEVRVVHSCDSTTQYSAFYGLYNNAVTQPNNTVITMSATVIGHRHWASCRWIQHYHTAGYVDAAQTIDVSHYVRGAAFPKFFGTAHTDVWPPFNTVGVGPFGPGAWRLMSLNGADTGTRNDIGQVPGHVVAYLANPSNAAMRAQTLQEADLSGSYNIHWGVDDTHDLISLDTYPNFTPHNFASFTGGGAGMAHDVDTTWYAGLQVDQFGVDFPHMPQPCHAAYILTGRRYYAEGTKHIANACMLASYDNAGTPGPEGRGGSAGYVGVNLNAARGHAWGLRNILCCYFLPDADQYKSYFTTRIASNLATMDTYAAASADSNPLGALYYEDFSPTWPEGAPTPSWIVVSPWQMYYMIPIAYWGTQLFPGVSGNGSVMLDRLCKYGMAAYNEPTVGVDRRAPYRFFTKFTNGGAVSVLNSTFYANWAAAYADQNTQYPAQLDSIWAYPYNAYYGPHVRQAYVFGKKIGLANATAAIAWMNAYDANGTFGSTIRQNLDLGTMAFAYDDNQ